MSLISRIAIPTAACDHCGAPVAASARYCCDGCEAAHGLVEGLGLDAFYRRRSAADGVIFSRFKSSINPYVPGTEAKAAMLSQPDTAAASWLRQ